ncbi:hypothetical protein ACF09H_18140 [Streptomyces sp. NPDC014983]|uniref:hypothetical protein n=1 Tax=Streptomyces sp. NPDC014983 TaxID=3364933 RepID=UPI0036F6ED57
MTSIVAVGAESGQGMTAVRTEPGGRGRVGLRHDPEGPCGLARHRRCPDGVDAKDQGSGWCRPARERPPSP